MFKKALFSLFIGICAVLLARFLTPIDQKKASIRYHQNQQTPINIILQKDEKNNVEVFREVSPSVVYISSIDIRRDFFSLNSYEIPQGAGTGFIWDKQGHIVTNFHVIGNADRIIVSLIDQTQYAAKFIGGDPDKDLAVLKIDPSSHELVPIKRQLGNPLIVGQKAIAIGNPFGLDHTMTVGIVSALEREIDSLTGRKIKGVIQTDAAINPGNSGGPLLNAQGEMIGVNTQIISKSGSSSGIGFAIPVDVVEYIVPQLIKYGKVQRVGLGISIVPEHFRRRLRLKTGVMIHEVPRGSAAYKAGLRGIQFNRGGQLESAHVIESIDNMPVRVVNDLRDILNNYKLGQTVQVKARRGNTLNEYTVKLQVIE